MLTPGMGLVSELHLISIFFIWGRPPVRSSLTGVMCTRCPCPPRCSQEAALEDAFHFDYWLLVSSPLEILWTHLSLSNRFCRLFLPLFHACPHSCRVLFSRDDGTRWLWKQRAQLVYKVQREITKQKATAFPLHCCCCCCCLEKACFPYSHVNVLFLVNRYIF